MSREATHPSREAARECGATARAVGERSESLAKPRRGGRCYETVRANKTPVTTSTEIRTLTTPQELFAAAAEEVVRCATEAVAQRGRFTIALSGGSTPKSLFNLLATNARTTLPWDKMFFFWGDERHVPPTDPDSNYRMADEAMLSKIPVKPENIFRIPAENPDATAAADTYEKTLQKFFALANPASSPAST